jgi:hypothetical protein
MNERQKVNKIIHTYVDVEKYGDYTDYKGLITALIDWKNEQLTLTDVSKRLLAEKIILALDDYGRSINRVEYGLPIDPDTKDSN